MEEEWRDIKGYEGLYQISSKGQVKSLARPCKGFGDYYAKERIKKISRDGVGYCRVALSKNGKKKHILVHRLVAKAFIPNPDNLPEVNHKDENKENNYVDNLEWCTPKYNSNYGNRNEKLREINRRYFKAVYQIDKNTGEIIKLWECIREASRKLSIRDHLISRVCKGRNETAGGYKWMYANDYDNQKAV